MSDTLDHIFVPPQNPSRRWFRRLTPGIVVVVLAASAAWLTSVMIRSCGSSWSGVYEVDGECVGVTDGSFVFHPEFTEVQRKIADENAWVRAESEKTGSPYVTVALLNPLTATRTSALSVEEIRNQLEGAYTALHRVNHTHAVEDPHRPLIQLVLANEGSTERQWRPVVDQLVEMTRQDSRLVAVVGMGVSIVQTRMGAEELSRHRIPMIGAIIAAGELEHSRIPGLVRVSPNTQDYARSFRGYLDKNGDLRSAVLLYDSNSDTGSDLYTNSLRDSFRQEFGGDLIKFEDLVFTGESIPADGNAAVFGRTTAQICASAAHGLRVVFYAGRRGDLDGLLSALENRSCRHAPLTLVVGTNPTVILEGREQQLRDARLTVVFSVRTNARGWGRGVEESPDGYPGFLDAFTASGFNPEHLRDERAILTHDALLTATQAVRLAASESASPGGLTSQDVFGQLMNLHGERRVRAASGTLSWSSRPQGAGNPRGKPVLVFRFPPPVIGGSWEVGPTYVTR